jgi:predicted nucleotidyltransferase
MSDGPTFELDTILECTMGSTLHGTKVSDGLEDLDIMGIVVEPAARFVGFFVEDTWTWRTKPDGVRSEAGDIDYVAYGLRKFLHLATKGNPTILLPLFAPEEHLRKIDCRGRQLRELAPHIVSKQVYAPFRGYMRQQHERLLGLRGQRNVTRPELVDAYGYDTKYASHIIRLGLQGEEILMHGRITLPMPEEQRELVVTIRNGGYTLAQVSEKIIEVENRIIAAYEKTALPDKPNMKAVQKWMVDIYLGKWAVLAADAKVRAA